MRIDAAVETSFSLFPVEVWPVEIWSGEIWPGKSWLGIKRSAEIPVTKPITKAVAVRKNLLIFYILTAKIKTVLLYSAGISLVYIQE